jgi:crotonobetainyl-CoA:carnitine CoA-transferase CaiB-like acyl-CoA transferase
VVRERGSIQHVGWPGGACQTKDGRWVAYTAPAQHLFERVCKMLGQPDLPQDERYATVEARAKHMRDFILEVERWFAAHTYAEASKMLEEHQVPYSPIMSMADIFAEPHYRERDMIIDVPEPTLGSLPQPGVVPKLSRTPGCVTHAGPPMGYHTEEILSGLLQMPPAEIEELRKEGVI